MDTRRQFKLMCFGLSSRNKSIIVENQLQFLWRLFVYAFVRKLFIAGKSFFAERLDTRRQFKLMCIGLSIRNKSIILHYISYLFMTTTCCLCIYVYFTLIQKTCVCRKWKMWVFPKRCPYPTCTRTWQATPVFSCREPWVLGIYL